MENWMPLEHLKEITWTLLWMTGFICFAIVAHKGSNKD